MGEKKKLKGKTQPLRGKAKKVAKSVTGPESGLVNPKGDDQRTKAQ